MSDYQWTEKQIKKAYESRKHKKGWLDARDIRSGIPAAAVRQLMKIMVDRKLAFDNLTSPDSDRYKICFNLEEKERMIKEIENSQKEQSQCFFDPSLLSDPRLVDLPPEKILDFVKSPDVGFYWNKLKIEWQEIYKEFFRYQNGGKMQDPQFIYASLLPGDLSKQRIKDMKTLLLSQTNTFISMYKSLKIGWSEIKHIYPCYRTYNDLFLEILSAHYSVKLFHLRTFEKSNQTDRTISSKLNKISNLPKIIIFTLEGLHENSNDPDKKCWKIILEEYRRDPHGQGLENAFNILLKFADEDTEENYLRDIINDFCKALSKLGSFPRLKSYADLLAYFETEEESSDDPLFDYLVELSNSYPIKETLRSSENQKVKDAVFEWVNAEKEIIEINNTIFRRKAQQPHLYKTGEITTKANRTVSQP